MNIVRIRLTEFRVPFVRPYVTAAGVSLAREGIIVQFDTDGGVTGVGESSLLPHEGSVTPLFEELVEGIGRFLGMPARLVVDTPLAGPAWAGVETAAWDADTKADGRPLSRWMWANAATSVAVNALVSAPAIDEAAAQTVAAGRDGYRTVKLKVGVAGSAAAEIARIHAVHEALADGCGLRLDANGAWDEATALAVLTGIDDLAIEYIEQPLPPGNLPGLQRLRAASSTPIAVDEEITNPQSARPVIEWAAADVVVLKPLALGGLQATYSIRGQAMRAGMETVITTSIDTGIGTALALHVAAGTESRFASGLATTHLLESDLLKKSLRIENGSMLVPEMAGLGVELDESALRRYAVREWAVGA